MNQRQYTYNLTPRTWVGWVVTAVVGFVLLATAALFLTVAVVVGLVIVAIVVARAYWMIHKAERRRREEFLETEYHVEDEEAPKIKDRSVDERNP